MTMEQNRRYSSKDTHTRRLSIIVPTLNEAGTIGECIAAARKACGSPEIIVVDGGSTDETLLLAKNANVVTISAPRGRAAQMNAGAENATGDIYIFLHADTRLPLDAASLISDSLERGGVWGRFDIRIFPSHWLLRIVSLMMNLRSRVTGIATGDQAIFVRREIFEKVGGFPMIPLMEDIALSMRLKNIRRPVCISNPVVTSARRWQKNGMARTIFLMWNLRLAFFLGASPQNLARRYRRSDPNA